MDGNTLNDTQNVFCCNRVYMILLLTLFVHFDAYATNTLSNIQHM